MAVCPHFLFAQSRKKSRDDRLCRVSGIYAGGIFCVSKSSMQHGNKLVRVIIIDDCYVRGYMEEEGAYRYLDLGGQFDV